MGVRSSTIVVDLGWNKILKNIKDLDGSSVDIGIFGNGGSASENLAERAAVHEFGTHSGKIPSRPFMRNAFDQNKKNLRKFIEKQYDRMIAGNQNASMVRKRTGEWFTGKVKEEITTGRFRPLSLLTITRKGSSKPLIDTGEMRASTKYKENRK